MDRAAATGSKFPFVLKEPLVDVGLVVGLDPYDVNVFVASPESGYSRLSHGYASTSNSGFCCL